MAEPKRPEITALLLLAAVKVGLLAIFGAIYWPDSYGYSLYADAIAKNDAWRTHVDLTLEPMPIVLVRMAGYPLLLASSRLLFGSHWELALVAIQILASMVATVMFWQAL